MSRSAPGAMRAATTVRWLLAIGLLVVSGAMPNTAWAYWNGGGSGTGSARVADLPSIAVVAESPQYSDHVDVSWTAPSVPAGMTITGYRVVRIAGGTPAPACGTTPSTPLPSTSLSCVDAGLNDGDADYVVTADVGTWTTTGATPEPVTVAADRIAPTIQLSGAERSNALLDRRDGEALLFFRPADGGSIRIDAELTDTEVGPASATFPALSAAGWTHDSETVTTGTGSAPTITYRSSVLGFAPGASTPAPVEITGVDERGNARARALTFVADADPPIDGALSVNGTSASVGGTQSWDSDGAFTVGPVTQFVEEETASASGLADVTLTRESAALAAGSCAAFGGASTVDSSAPVEEAGLPDGCYRYTLTGVDRVGNSASISSTVRVDTTAPVGGALQANAADAVPGGSVSITGSGSWSVSRTDYTDAESGIVSSTLTRALGTLTAGQCQSYGAPTTLSGSPGEASAATGCYRYVLTGVNGSGLASELSTTVQVDRAAPTGGGMTVNGGAATGAGSTSTSVSSTVTVSALTGFIDANSGIDTNEMTRTYAPMSAGVCGTFDPASETPVTGTAPFTVTGLADGCHRFTLTGTDLAGNTSSVLTTVRLDASAPTSGSITVAGVPGTAAGVMAYARVNPVVVAWTKFSDPESGITVARVDRTTSASLTNGVCGTPYASAANLTATLTPLAGTSSQTLSTTTLRCYQYVLTGTNSLGVTSTLQVTVMFDSSALTSTGSLTVNNSTSTTTPSTNTSGTYTVSTVRSFADAQSGIASNILTRTSAPVTASVCGTYDPLTTVTLASPAVVPPVITETGMAPGCYRYTQTGTNAVGASITVSTFVRVDTTRPVGALRVNGVDAASSPTTSQSVVAYPIVRTDFTDPETTMTSSTLVRTTAPLLGGVCGTTYGSATTLTGAPTQTGLTSACHRYVLTGTNSLTLSAAVSTIVAYDPSPSGGAFTINTTAATGPGSSLNLAAGANFSVTAFTAYTETQSVLVSSTFTRTTGVSTAGVCGNFDSATTVTLPSSTQPQNALPNGCYRYVLTGVNSFGGTASVTSTVRVGP